MAKETYEQMQARLTKAFDLVCNKEDWRAEIQTFVSDPVLAAAGVSIEEVREAVIHFTATVPSFSRFWEGEGGYWVTAIGYRNGPAGS